MAIEYEYKTSEVGDVEQCISCYSEAPLHNFGRPELGEEERNLCEVCSTTHIGRMTIDFSRRYGVNDLSTLGLARAIAQTTNMLLDKIEDRKSPGSDK